MYSLLQLQLLIIVFIYKLKYSIIRTEGLTNIIKFNTTKLQYANFATYSNGDMIFETTKYEPNNGERYFYGFKKNGRGFFNYLQNNNNYYLEMNLDSKSGEKFESDNIIIKESNSGKEYLIGYGKANSSAEIYDFENNIVYMKRNKNFTNKENVTSYRFASMFLNMDDSNSYNYYYLFGFIGWINNKYCFILQKHKFNSVVNFSSQNTLVNETSINNISPKRISGISCFQTEKKYIICFFADYYYNFTIAVYDIELIEIKNITFISNINNDNDRNCFYKCIYLKKEVGVFVYYTKNINDYFTPHILFKEYQETTPDIKNFTIPEIILDQLNCFLHLRANDIIRLNENKICFISTVDSKDKLYITLINLYEDQYYLARVYLIKINEDYQFKIHNEIRVHNYNNFIAFGFSYSGLDIEANNNSVALLIFNYPNSTDQYLYLDQYLYVYTSINNININLTNEVRIESAEDFLKKYKKH